MLKTVTYLDLVSVYGLPSPVPQVRHFWSPIQEDQWNYVHLHHEQDYILATYNR